MPKNKLSYFEFPAGNVAALKEFYGTLFGWTFQDYGEDYAAFSDAGLDGGFNAAEQGRTRAPLAIVETDDLEKAEATVRSAGGTITQPIFDFPGGRRFHFTDPSGNELAVMQLEP